MQAESSATERTERRGCKRLVPLMGTLLILFWPELIFIVTLFRDDRSICVAIRDTEAMGFVIIYLMVAHGLQLPLLFPLGIFWYATMHRQARLARVGYAMLIPVMVAASYLFFARVGLRWFPGAFYVIGLLLLSPALMRYSK